MDDAGKTKAQLIEELARLRQELAESEIPREEGPQGREAFVAGVKDQVWRMKGTGDIRRVLRTVHQGLGRLGMSYHACDINLVDSSGDPPLVSYYTLDGDDWREGEEEEGRETVLRIWREGKIAYRGNLLVEDINQERTYLERQFGLSIRSVLDIPFSTGTLAINSQQANAFSPEAVAILQEVAEVLGDGFRRMKDLRVLEQRTEELEREISERRQVEEALRESEERYRLLIERLPVGVAHTTPAGKFLYHNPYARNLMGYSLEELAGMEVEEIYVHPEDREDLLRNLREKGEHTFEYLLRRKDGKEIWVQGTTRAIEDDESRVVELEGFTLDITERKRAEDLLRADLGLQRVRNQVLQMRFGDDWEEVARCVHRELGELMAFDGLGINIVDREGESFYSYAVTPDGLIEGDTIEFLPLALRHAIDEGETVYRRNRKDMTEFNDAIGIERKSAIDVPFIGGTIGASSAEEDAFGEREIRILEQFAGAVSDAYRRREDLRLLEQRSRELEAESAELRQMEEVLQQSERSYRELFDNMDSGVVVYEATEDGADFLIVDINEAGEKISQVRKRDILGCRSTEVFPGVEEMGLLEVFRQVWKSGEHRRHPVARYKDDQIEIWVENAVYKLPAGQVVAIFHDATEQKRLEEELVRTERLRAVGELSAGVSHNLNNMLVSILGPAQLLRRKSDDPDVLREADEIIVGARRARDLVHRLNLAVRGEVEKETVPVPVNQVVRDAIQTARPRWETEGEARGVGIEIATDLEEVPDIRGTGTGLHEILLNLLLNAVDAMPEGGVITVDTRLADEEVKLTVRDTGIGMNEGTKQRVFEPFFTTKMDVGSGLGLATVHGAIERWGGRVEVESEPGEGSIFALWLPIWSGEARGEREAACPETGRMRRGRLLIAEDDEGIRGLLERLLEGRHQVALVADGREGLERFAAGSFDAVLIDLAMPGMPGDQVAREMKRIDPAIGTVLITGWDIPPGDDRLAFFDFKLGKPFDDLDNIEAVIDRAIELRDERVRGRN